MDLCAAEVKKRKFTITNQTKKKPNIMKTSIGYLLTIPLAGVLILTGCKTTNPPPPHEATAAPAVAVTAPYLVNLAAKAPTLVSAGDTYVYELQAKATYDVANVMVTETL